MKPEKVVKSLFVNCSLFVLIVFSVFKIDSNFPAIKGLHELFIPDVIGIGRALKTKGWIENVYDFAPDGNLAKEVIKIFWHKVSEKEVIQPTQLAPVSEITAEVFGKILNYIRVFRENGENSSLKAEIVKLWIDSCRPIITEINKTVIANIENQILDLKEKNILLERQKVEVSDSFIVRKERDFKIEEIQKKINPNNKLIKNKLKTIDSFKRPFEVLEKTKELSNNIIKIMCLIEKLLKNEDFMPEITESILWAFFEDKFTECEKREAISSLNICLKQLGKNIEKYEEYDAKDYLVFEDEIKSIDDSEDKIVKIIGEYDRSTNSAINLASLKNVPTEINSPQMVFQHNGKRTRLFSTCFEKLVLDCLSNLLYDPKEKKYELKVLPEEARKSEFFLLAIEKVFKDKEKTGFIASSNINAKFQEWINIISNKPGIEYYLKEKINEKEFKYGLNTSIENLIKILNELFNLGIEIKYNLDTPEKLEITNFDNIIKTLGIEKGFKPKNVQYFWNIIFDFVSKKMSTDNFGEKGVKRSIKFTCNLYNQLEISGLEDKIITSGSIGNINIAIIYNNKEYKKFNVDFNLDISSKHSRFECLVKPIGLTIYGDEFKDLIVEKISQRDFDKKLLPTFILLADLEMANINDKKLQNIFCYCMRLKSDQEKVDLIKAVILKNMLENDNVVDLICKLIEKLPEDNNIMSGVLYEIIGHKIDEKSANKIIQKVFDKKIIYKDQVSRIVTRILNSENDGLYLSMILEKLSLEDPEKFIVQVCREYKAGKNIEEIIKKIIEKNPEINLSQIDQDGFTALYYAQESGYENICKLLLDKAQPFDKITYFIKTNNPDAAINIIRKRDIDIDGPDWSITPLHEAIKKENVVIVKEILNHKKVNINKIYRGNTPLKMAVIYSKEKSKEIITLLLEHKNIENNAPDIDLNSIKDALDLAKELGKDYIVDILKVKKRGLVGKI